MHNVTVTGVVKEHNDEFEGFSIADVAARLDKDPLDAFLGLALDEDLLTEFNHPVDPGGTAEHVTFPYGELSVSDGGAHVRFLEFCSWPVVCLSKWVRDKEVMMLEQAHYKISALPAWLASFKHRGTLCVGAWADMMIYNHRIALRASDIR